MGGALFLLGASASGDSEDWRRLEQGAILVTDASVTDADNVSQLRGKAVVLIDAPPGEVWHTITDHENYAEFMPSLVRCEVLEDTGRDKLVSYHVKLVWVDIHYHLRLQLDPERMHIEYRLDRTLPHDNIADAAGAWDLEPVSGGKRTRLNYTVYLDAGRFVPRFVERSLSKRQLPQILENVRRRVLSGGTWKRPEVSS